MAKKKAAKTAQQPKAPMTKRELTRWQKQKQQEQLAFLFVVATIVLVSGILVFGIWREILSRPGETVARVGSGSISLGMLADEIKYRAKTLDKQIELTNVQVRQYKTLAQTDTTAGFYAQYAEQQLQQLQTERYQLSNGQTLMEDLIERELIRQEVVKRGGNVTAADIDLDVQRQFQPQAPASEPITDTATVTDTANITPAPVPTAIPADAWKARYKETLTTYKITDAEFRRFTLEPQLWRTKLGDSIAAIVLTTTEQVHARHILLTTEADANDVLALLKQAPAMKFEDLATARSTDTGTKDNGGDLGWFARGAMAPEFEAAAFSLQPGQISGVISTTFGFHIIRVDEKDANHPLDSSQLDEAKSQAFSDWLSNTKGSADIKRSFDSNKQLWLNKQIPAAQY